MPVVEPGREIHRPDPAALLVPEVGAALDLEARRADLIRHAQPLEDREVEGKKRLADVEPRKRGIWRRR